MKSVLILALLFSANLATAAVCYSTDDRQIGWYTGTDTQDCTAPGYCYGYGYNPDTGEYEYYYGFQSSCPGHQDRQIDRVDCQRPDGTQYTVDNSGPFGICQTP